MIPIGGGGVDHLVAAICGPLVALAAVWLTVAVVVARPSHGTSRDRVSRTASGGAAPGRAAFVRAAFVRAAFLRPGLALLGVAGALAGAPTAAASTASPAVPAHVPGTVVDLSGRAAAAPAPGLTSHDGPAAGDPEKKVTDSRHRAPSLWPVGGEQPPGEVAGEPVPDRVVVHRGDTLWSLAAGRLPPGASPGEVLRAVHQWHRLNRAVIGSDPDLILPGQVLRVPARSGHPTASRAGRPERRSDLHSSRT